MPTASNRSAARPFTGTLSATDAVKGAQLIRANAVRLLEDAKCLLEAKRYPSAAMVAVMALNELSRFFHPLTLAAIERPERLLEGWRQFRAGRQDFPWSAFQTDSGLLKLGSATDAALNDMLFFISRLARGVDFIEPGLWIDPAALIPAELAASIVGTAELFCREGVSVQSMELWMEAIDSLPPNASLGATLKVYQKKLESAGLAGEADVVARVAG